MFGFLGKIGKALIPGLGDASQAMASNRGTKAELMLDEQDAFERQLMAREMEKRRAQSSAYRNAMVGAHNVNYQPSIRPVGVPGSYQSTATSAEGRMAGGELFSQGMRRLLQPDQVNQTAPSPLLRLMENPEFRKTLSPGLLEKILGIVGGAGPAVKDIKFGGGSNHPAYTEGDDF